MIGLPFFKQREPERFGEESVVVKGREFRIETERSRGSTARVNIRGSLIRIRLPLYMSRSNAIKTHLEFKQWAVRKLERMDHSQLDPKPRFIEFKDGQELNVMGKRLVISVIEEGKKPSGRISGGNLILRLPAGLSGEQRARKLHNLARRTITRTFTEELEGRTRMLNEANFGLGFNGMAIRDQMTRWGSCSRNTRRININFRLLLAPTEIMDYVLVHELAHLKHANHSARFWELVARAVPDYKEKRRWLNKNGNSLGSTKTQPVVQVQ